MSLAYKNGIRDGSERLLNDTDFTEVDSIFADRSNGNKAGGGQPWRVSGMALTFPTRTSSPLALTWQPAQITVVVPL